MKRHVALTPLSSDHHRALVQARRLTRAAAGHGDAAAAATAAATFARRDLAQHFRREEEILLPEFARWATGGCGLCARVADDHLAIRALLLDLERATLEEAPLSRIEAALGERLEAHVRFEERELFPAVEAALPPERLAAIGVLLTAGMPGD